MPTKPIIAMTMGDFNGIGPEVVLRSVVTPSIQHICTPLLIGSLHVFEWYARRLNIKIILKEIGPTPTRSQPGIVPVIPLRQYEAPNIQPGKLSNIAGRYAGEAIEKAAELSLKERVDGMVTAPVSKEAMQQAGYDFPGQTEMLATMAGSKNVAMMLVAGTVRVGLVTVHTPLKKVSQQISKKTLLNKLTILNNSLKKDFAIPAPTIAVMGLNPHAGEHGMIGTEEQRYIIPAIQHARAKRIQAEGPFPADGFWGTHRYKMYDAVLAMYHDQGLIPLKMKGFEIGVNFSAGLPIIRTSPDHGTAFDIAGKGIANPTSMKEAIKLAVTIARNRKD